MTIETMLKAKAHRILDKLGMTSAVLEMTLRSFRAAALALFALTGFTLCGKIDGPDNPDDGWVELNSDLPVRFSTGITTKATSPLPDNTTFGVFAFYQPGTALSPGTWNSSRTPNFMYNEDVLFDGSTYTYSPLKYWPNNDYNTITFWAYCPYNASNLVLRESGSTSTAYSNTSTGIPDLFYTVTDGKTDLLASELVQNESKQGLSESVLLPFHHTLSKLAFYVKKVDSGGRYTVNLTNVRLDQVYKIATYSCNSGAWSGWALPRGSVASYADDPIPLTTSYPSDANPMVVSYVLPQDLSGAGTDYTMLHIEYTIWFEGLSEVRTMISNIPLRTVFEDVSARWDKEKEYKIYISITPDDPIEFSVIWSNWGTVHNWSISS